MVRFFTKPTLILALFSVIGSAQAGTTTSEFLKWERKNQESFLDISITMAGVIAAQSKPKVAKCLDGWYFESVELQDQRYQEILDFMPRLKEYSPTTVVLSILNDVCGEF